MVKKMGEGSASDPFSIKSIKFDKSCVGQSVSEFDCAYGYSIGWCSGSLISNNYTGVLATLNDHSTTTVRSWTSDFISLPTCKKMDLDGLVFVGCGQSCQKVAKFAEYFAEKG